MNALCLTGIVTLYTVVLKVGIKVSTQSVPVSPLIKVGPTEMYTLELHQNIQVNWECFIH